MKLIWLRLTKYHLQAARRMMKSRPAPKGSPSQPFTAEEHEARFMQELSSRLPDRVCAEIVAMSKDLDRLDPRWLGRTLAGT